MFCTFCVFSFVPGSNNLNGTLPSELGNLSNLRDLRLRKCLELVFHQYFWSLFVCCAVGMGIESIIISFVRMKTKHMKYNTLIYMYFFLVSMYYWLIQFRSVEGCMIFIKYFRICKFTYIFFYDIS